MTDDPLYTVREAADLMSSSRRLMRRTVRSAVRRGEMPSVPSYGYEMLIPRSWLEAWIERQREEAP